MSNQTPNSSLQERSSTHHSDDDRRLVIGVSSCLLGHGVRYDGKHKYHSLIATHLCSVFHCLPICPEYAIGLGVPREPIKLVRSGTSILAIGVNDSSVDVTTPLQTYAESVSQQFPTICGYVFKSRSPSCAIQSAPLSNIDEQIVGFTSGIFAQHLLDRFPGLPVIEETALTDDGNVEQFAQSVKRYANAAGIQ